jgi:hypothetical protein
MPLGSARNRPLFAIPTTVTSQLAQHRAADVADADHRQRQPLPGLEEPLVDGVERAHLL